MFKKTNEKNKNKNCSDNNVYVSRFKNIRKFNNHDFFTRIDIKKCNNINRKKYTAKI